MNFIFTCPNTQELFHSEQFDVVDNQGVVIDSAGNKVLDAKVQLTSPCPPCGERHIFKAGRFIMPLYKSRGEERKGRKADGLH